MFWFLVTCAAFAGSGYYLRAKIETVRTLPQYVYTGSPELYYLTPDLDVETRSEMHRAQTRLAMETIFNRTPSSMDNKDRISKMFTYNATEQVINGFIKPQQKNFRDNGLHQKVEIGEIIVNVEEGQGESTTVATGQLIRTGVNEDRMVNEVWSVKMFFTWKINPDFENRPMYPTICDSVNFFSMERTFP